MNLRQFQKLLNTDPLDSVINLLQSYQIIRGTQDAYEQYTVDTHLIFDKRYRPDRKLTRTETIEGAKVEVSDGYQLAARLPLAIQKRIVTVAAAFVGAPEIDSSPETPKEKELIEIFDKISFDNKLSYKSKRIIKHVMSEKECAELWYTIPSASDYWEGYPIKPKENLKLGMKILAPSLGDELFPVYDDYGDLIIFGHKYQLYSNEDNLSELVTHFDVYTADEIYYTKQVGTFWYYGLTVNGEIEYSEGVKSNKNPIKKIPLVYTCQPYTEWHDVQPLIERLEEKISNHAETNDAFDKPILLGVGNTISLPDGKETQKYIEISDTNGDLRYVTWDNAPESMKMEIENLLRFIGLYTHTPDISFESMKGLGIFSGTALKNLYLDPHLKADDNEEKFSESHQRRINLIRHIIVQLDESFKEARKLRITPKFKRLVPNNDPETVDAIVKAKNAGIMSQETSVNKNPYITNPKDELVLIKKEQTENEAKEIKKAEDLAKATASTVVNPIL